MRDHAIVQSKAAKEAQKEQYDKIHKVKQVQMAIGQRVLSHQTIAQPEKPRKFQARLAGPFDIKKVLPNNVYIVEHIATHQASGPIGCDQY